MSLLIHYENGVLKQAQRLFARTTPSPVYAAKDRKTFVLGEVFGASYEDVAESGWQENPGVLNRFEAAISVVSADESGCAFATDLNGIERLYTYHNKNVFILSDDFWDIVKIIQPSYEDIDPVQARLSLVGKSTTGETLIRNLKLVFPFSIGKYNPIVNQLSVSRYMDFKYTGEISNLDEAVERMDQILDQSMQKIKTLCGDVVYGLGVSGGLDSRVALHYATKNEMKLVGFNVCVPRPHKLFQARSCKNARQIAQAFNTPFQIVKWNPSTVDEKIKTKAKNYPLGSGRNSFKYEPEVPQFDVLLAGSTGEIVGDSLPAKINDFSREELIGCLMAFFSKEENLRTFSARAARALNYLLGTNLKGSSASAIQKLLNPEDIQKIRDGISKFVDDGILAAQTNLEIYENFLLNVVGFQNRYGAFESMLGTKRSFSIYIPFLLKETLKWSPDLLVNRTALKALIVKMIPSVKNVQAESYEPAPGLRHNIWFKTANMVDFLARGNGVAIDEYWIKKTFVKKKLAVCLDNGCQWFAQIFNTDTQTLKSIVMNSREPELMINVWELKTLVDYLETKEYFNF